MKNRIVIVAILALWIFAPGGVQAQMHFSLFGGTNVASLMGEDAMRGELPPRNRIGLGAGLGMITFLGGPFGFRFDILYLEKGARYTGIGEPVTFTLTYIELPALLEFYIYTKNDLIPKFCLGTSFAINIGSKLQTADSSTNLKDETEKTELGLVVGVGVDILERFEFSIRYSVGLLTIHRNDAIDRRTECVLVFAGILL